MTQHNDIQARNANPSAQRSVRSMRQLRRDTRGAALAEYVILVGLVAMAAFAGYKTFGESVNAKIGKANGAINSLPEGVGGR